MNARERISHVDNAWLRMDRPENLMQILGVMIFKGRIDAERFKRTVAQRMLRYRRFRQIARQDADGSWWADDPDFDIDSACPPFFSPGSRRQTNCRSSLPTMASTPLNPARPRWEFNLVDTADGNSALVVRIHHAIADGIALIGVINSLTDNDIDAAPRTAGRQAATSADSANDRGGKRCR
jgi:diacylglycerol O-acyltransferase